MRLKVFWWISPFSFSGCFHDSPQLNMGWEVLIWDLSWLCGPSQWVPWLPCDRSWVILKETMPDPGPKELLFVYPQMLLQRWGLIKPRMSQVQKRDSCWDKLREDGSSGQLSFPHLWNCPTRPPQRSSQPGEQCDLLPLNNEACSSYSCSQANQELFHDISKWCCRRTEWVERTLSSWTGGLIITKLSVLPI